MTSHAGISYVKSIFRIAGYVMGAFATVSPMLFWCFVVLTLAEVIGIVEEVGH